MPIAKFKRRIAPPRRRYGVIYSDPPWLFRTYSSKGTGRGAVSHYDVMTYAEIKALPVGDWALPDSAYLLWVPGPHLKFGFELMEIHGFTYKASGFVWPKPTKGLHRLMQDAMAGKEIIRPKEYGKLSWMIGPGYGTRKNVEFCLLGTRGSPHRLSKAVRELVVEPRRQHSQKPDRIRDDIRALYRGPYLEMFARTTHPHWDSWGNQTTLLDYGPVKTRRQPSSLVSHA